MPASQVAPSEKDMQGDLEEITAGVQEVSSDPNRAILFWPVQG
jgi:hypothetical protein